MNKRNGSVTKLEINGRKADAMALKHSSNVYNTMQTGTEEVVNGATTFVKTFGIGKAAKTYRVFVK